MDILGIRTLGFKLDGHVFDAEVRGDAVLGQLLEIKPYVCVFIR